MKLPSAARWSELQPHVDVLLSCNGADRARKLEALTADDPALGDELRGLLAALTEAEQIAFLDRPAQLPNRGPGIGDPVGPWTLVEQIGEGGMASVWRARRSDGRFEGEAAIKLLKHGLFDAEAEARFRREGAILARLQHPGIARLLDAGILSSGQPYLVLELVHGQTIDRWCNARRLSARACIEVFDRVLDAVAAAHAQLVIHRDLKPTNILIDDAGQVHLLDFGIARLQDDADPALTRDGTMALTPRYAAPEQFSGGVLSVSTDVYALGVVLYELLTGAHPSGLAPSASTLDYMRATAAGDFEPASVAAARRELRGDLDTVLAKALATPPDERYSSVGALQDDLRRHLQHEPIQARPGGIVYRARKLLRRRPFECAAVLAVAIAIPAGAHLQAAVLLSMAGGTGAALWQARKARRVAVLARAEQQRAEAVQQFIASIFDQAVPRSGPGGVVTAGDLLQSAAKRIATELRGQPQIAAELMAMVGASFMKLGDEPSARRILPDAVARCEQAYGRLDPRTVEARCLQIDAHNASGELDVSDRLLPPLLAELRQGMPGSVRGVMHALRCRSYLATKRGHHDEALADLREAWSLAREHVGPDAEETLAIAGQLGNTLCTFQRMDEALAVLEQAVATARARFGEQRTHVLLALLEAYRADALGIVGRYQEASAELRQVLRDQLLLDGMETDRNRYTKTALARVLTDAGAVEEGLQLIREAIAADERLFAKPSVDKAVMQVQLGWTLVECGEPEAALEAFERAEALNAEAGGQDVLLARLRRAHLASACLQAGRVDQALAIAAELIDDGGRLFPGARATCARVRAGALRRLGRLDECDAAVSAMQEAARAAAVLPLQRVRADLEAGSLRLDQGRHAEATVLVRGALDLVRSIQYPGAPMIRRAEALLERCNRHAAA